MFVVIGISIIMLVACSNSVDKQETELDKNIIKTSNNDVVELTEESEGEEKVVMETEKTIDPNEYEANKTMIAKELGMDANNRELKYIMEFFYYLDDGLIMELSFDKTEKSEELYIKLENGHEYRYLLNNGAVDAVYGITQGKWLITSER